MPLRVFRSTPAILLALLFSVTTLLTLTVAVEANMAVSRPEFREGDRVVEPAGSLRGVHIERETLLIDMRPLAVGRPVIVEANYRVRNDGERRDINLIFIAQALAPDENAGVWSGSHWVKDERAGRSNASESGIGSGVWLDSQPVSSTASDEITYALPKSWQTPDTTPTLEGRRETLPYKVTSNGTISFSVSLAPGAHTFRVRYAARPAAYSAVDSDAVYWQLGYVLAPAREWASFGGLDARVLLPRGWRSASAPSLRREGDTLVGSWDEIPADALALTVQTNERTTTDVGDYWVGLIVVGALLLPLAGLVGWFVGRALGERRRTSAWALLLAPLVALASAILAGACAELISRPPAPKQAAFNQPGDYSLLITAPLLIAIFLLSLVAAQLCAFLARRRDVKRIEASNR